VEKNREFSVEQLETILLSEAELRGERLFRISVSPHADCFFPRQRFSIDIARMENRFNVIRVSPPEHSWENLPEKVTFFVTTALAFEKAAELASRNLNGAVDIMEIPFDHWKAEVAKCGNERPRSHLLGAGDTRMDVILLILSYKVLQYDMKKMMSLIDAAEETERAGLSVSDFEARLDSFQSSRISFLVFQHGGKRYIIPRFMVLGFAWGDSPNDSEPEGLGRKFGQPPLSPDRNAPCPACRFGIALETKGSKGETRNSFIAADRLLHFEEHCLRDIRLSGRQSDSCFFASTPAGERFLYLPQSPRP
jgi:hypothetical protein